MNRHYAIQNDVAYVNKSYFEYTSISSFFGEDESACFYKFVDSNQYNEGVLFVVSSFENPKFGFPYLEDSYISLSPTKYKEYSFYANFTPSSKTYVYEGNEYCFEQMIDFVIPNLDPLEEKHPIEKIVILVCPAAELAGKEELQCVFNCTSEENKSLFSANCLGSNIKATYQLQLSSFSSFLNAMAIIPLAISSLLVFVIACLFYASCKSDSHIIAFYSKNALFAFGESMKIFLLSLILPTILGGSVYAISCVALGYRLRLPILMYLFLFELLISIVFSLVESRGARNELH
ncbi:MAG: hypothetical protein MJ239_01125 [Bacilli bacterium]|nr:hypothetical protein [Bacilli bacterium]